MEIKTESLNEYTNKIDKLSNHSNNHKIIIYALITCILILKFVFVCNK